MIKPWLFEFFPELSGAPAPEVEQYFGRYLRLWARDEELGFEGIFFSEHHFGGSFSPSPHLLIAAMAGRTTRLRLGATIDEARESAAAAAARFNAFVAQDQRFSAKVPDAPAQSGAFKISEEEYITGTPKDVAAAIIQQCRATGAGNFLAVLHWSAPIAEVERAHAMFGREVIPLLRSASL